MLHLAEMRATISFHGLPLFGEGCPKDSGLNAPLLMVSVYPHKIVNSKRKKEPKKEK